MLNYMALMLKSPLRALDIAFRAARGGDYRTINEYLLKINGLRSMDDLLAALSQCLEELLDYEVFGFAMARDEALDIWIDPDLSDTAFLSLIQKDFPGQKFDGTVQPLHRGNGQESRISDRGRDLNYGAILSLSILEATPRTRLYVQPRRRMLSYHHDLLQVVVRAAGISVKNILTIKSLEGLAAVDPLTGCYNSRAMNAHLDHAVASAKRYGGDVSVIMFDLDGFKTINDHYGHLAGDRLLREVSGTVLATTRKSDYLARYGGDEFVVLMPNTALREAVEQAERLRTLLARTTVALNGDVVRVTSSFGVACLAPGMDAEGLLRQADVMLYCSKARGRNQVSPAVLKVVRQRKSA